MTYKVTHIAPSLSLDELIELARQRYEKQGYTEEERLEQIRSFAYGNVRLHNPAITQEDIDGEMRRLGLLRNQSA